MPPRKGFTLIDPGRYLRGDKSVQRKAGKSGFTLIELLVVIAIVAVLAVVVVLVLNPAQLLQQARDSNRLSDLATLTSSLGYYVTDSALSGSQSLGSANTVYSSLPDPAATSTAGDQCQGLGLPAMPSPYAWHCAASSTYRKTDGTGWIPVNFAGMTTGSPLGQLPTDPANTSSSRLFYAYATNGSQFEVTAAPESQKYRLGGSADAISGDGGTLATVAEKGSKIGLEPLDYGDAGLVGLWTMDEGGGSIAYDYSGTNATGSWQGTPSGTNGYYSAGKVGSWTGRFDGVGNYINIGNATSLSPTVALTMAAWIRPGALASGTNYNVINKLDWGNKLGYRIILGGYGSPNNNLDIEIGNSSTLTDAVPNISFLDLNNWHHIASVFVPGSVYIYVDGQQRSVIGTAINAIVNTPLGVTIGAYYGSEFFQGSLDDVRLYNRALSAAEIQAMYNGGK